MSHRLYSGEALDEGAGHPALVRFEPGEPDRPLVVFLPGLAHFARIAYGHPEGEPRDFLCWWLRRAGFPTLAISYPLLHPLFGTPRPGFGVAAWARQAMDLARRHAGDRRGVVVLAWSFAGTAVGELARAAADSGLDLELVVALAATPPLPGLGPHLDGEPSIPRGFRRWFRRGLQRQDELAGHVVVPPHLYEAEFVAPWPPALAAGADLPDFPPVAVVTGDAPLDARHALTDPGVWTLFVTQGLYRRHVRGDLRRLPPARFRRLREVLRGAPARLTATVEGTHFFFVGEPGARATVEAVERLRREAGALGAELADLLGR